MAAVARVRASSNVAREPYHNAALPLPHPGFPLIRHPFAMTPEELGSNTASTAIVSASAMTPVALIKPLLLATAFTSLASALFDTAACNASQIAYAQAALDDAFDAFHKMYLYEKTGVGIGKLSCEDLSNLRSRYFGPVDEYQSFSITGSCALPVPQPGSAICEDH